MCDIFTLKNTYVSVYNTWHSVLNHGSCIVLIGCVFIFSEIFCGVYTLYNMHIYS